MEEEIVRLLSDTQTPAEGPRKQAEAQLRALFSNEAFASSLCTVASHDSVPLNIRQAALIELKNFVVAGWSPQLGDDFGGQVLLSDENKARVRSMTLELATSDVVDRKVKTAASYVVSKIASADFPDDWPDLLPNLLNVIRNGSENQLHGALRVLKELVDDCFNDTQFFAVARDLVKVIYDVAVNDSRKPMLRALAVSVFLSSLNILEMVMEDHRAEVKSFAEEALGGWIPFFAEVLKSRLPPTPPDGNEEAESHYRGLVALKLQVVKALMQIRSAFSSILTPHSPVLFSATWEELSSLQGSYHEMYINDDMQSRLEDADGLPYTLDFLILEELDFMQACLRAPPVKKELEQQLKAAQGIENTWVTEVMKLAVAYAQITTEAEGLWDFDVNLFLCEETNVTANYTPRIACGDLLIKLNEWQPQVTVDGLLAYARIVHSTDQTWKAKEAVLYILNQLLSDLEDTQRQINPEAANGFIEFVRFAMQQEDEFLRARGYLAAGSLTRTSGGALQHMANSFMEATLNAIANDQSEVVKVACIRALQYYLQSIPSEVTQPLQSAIMTSLSNYIAAQDLEELADSEDLMVTVVETLRDVIHLDARICLTGAGLDLLFSIASHGPNNFHLTLLVSETFEEVAQTISALGTEAYVQLCGKVLPSLNGAFDVGAMTEENALTNLAADLLSVLTEHGSEPLPDGFVSTVMPKLNRLLLQSSDDSLLRSATDAVKNILTHDSKQLFGWHSEEAKSGLEVVLVIIDRLLGPGIDDNAAAEVGGLAAELVEKAGSEQLGPYLMQLLRAVTVRLSSATQAQFIQSLIMVFARLSLINAGDVVNFLAQVEVGQESGLQVVMRKWLENSVTFAGYDEIRQKYVFLNIIYFLLGSRPISPPNLFALTHSIRIWHSSLRTLPV
jgi:importin-9